MRIPVSPEFAQAQKHKVLGKVSLPDWEDKTGSEASLLSLRPSAGIKEQRQAQDMILARLFPICFPPTETKTSPLLQTL